MTPDHYDVPPGLHISLVGYVRWAWDDRSHYITTLWRDTTGNYFYYEDVWTPYSPPFWLGIGTADLTPCDSDSFAEHAETLWRGIEDLDEALSTYYRYRELMTVWGILEGVETGFTWLRTHNETFSNDE